MAFVDETPTLTDAEVDAARAAFMNDPENAALPTESGEPPAAPAADPLEQQAIEELLGTQPPAATGEPPAPAPSPAPPGPAADPYSQFGGEQAVRDAMAMSQAMRTEQGIRALIANGISALYGPDAVQAVRQALEGAPPEAQYEQADPFAGLDPDEPLTAAQVRDLWIQFQESQAVQQEQALAQTVTPLQQAILEQQNTAVRNVTDAAVISLLGPVPNDPAQREAYGNQVDAIVERGLRYYQPDQWNNPSHIQQVIQRAHAELNQEHEARFQAYLQSKRTTQTAQPPNIAAGASVEGALPEPKNLDEARKQLRDSGFFN